MEFGKLSELSSALADVFVEAEHKDLPVVFVDDQLDVLPFRSISYNDNLGCFVVVLGGAMADLYEYKKEIKEAAK